MARNRNARKSGRIAKSQPPVPNYYITSGRSQSGLPEVTPREVPKKRSQPRSHSAPSTTPSRPKKRYKIYKAKLNPLNLLVVLGYSVLPALTAIKILPMVDWRYLVGSLVLIWIITWHLYASDKKSAKSDSWRISENTLHFFEFIGGWPIAYLAQERLRHKTRKVSYQLTFWAIVILHQLLCLIYLNNPQSLINILPINK